jgi:hypothetical protein
MVSKFILFLILVIFLRVTLQHLDLITLGDIRIRFMKNRPATEQQQPPEPRLPPQAQPLEQRRRPQQRPPPQLPRQQQQEIWAQQSQQYLSWATWGLGR